jgi:monoamine oxidase
MNRRNFLKIGGLAVASASLGSFSFKQSGSKKKVIIIGAGMAGAGAARLLKDEGYEVIVIEARDRIGGRIWSDKSLGTTIDLGAGWIEDATGNPVGKLAEKFGLQTRVSDFDSVNIYNTDGLLLNEDKATEVYRESQRFLQRSLRYGYFQDHDISFEECMENTWKDTTMEDSLKRMVKWRISTEEINAAIEFSKLSAWGETEKGYWGDYLIVPGGYAEIPKKLLEGIDVVFNSPVLEVIDKGQEVEVKTADKSYSGDFVIVTLPLGVLKKEKLKFTPALSAEKKGAIQNLGMGNMNKLAIKYPHVFWENDKHFIGNISENYGEFPVFINWAYYSDGQPYLMAAMGNAFSEKLNSMTYDEQIAAVNKCIRNIYPKAPDALSIKFSGWKWQEFSEGSYSYLPVGVKEELRDALAEPHGRILFAGEATIKGYFATVHGALLSGQREAERIIEL